MILKLQRMLTAASVLLSLSACADAEKDKVSMSDSAQEKHAHTNHLIDENSPYLLSHAHNPVNWYPWGEEALARAKAEDKPIFLSIGYAACHWCHVMERESFENEQIAAIMNEHYISIKVDREQRPDLDHIYMAFTTVMTGHGGWPMSVFLTPELKPFYAGTYFPPEDAMGRPGFRTILGGIATAYKDQKSEVFKQSESVYAQLSQRLNAMSVSSTALSSNMITQGAQGLLRNFDQKVGGFGNKPKFPHPLELSLFLRYSQTEGQTAYLEATEKALKAMARGGIYDHLGGGFARYSTDARWLVPHFEKMLYDNALLVPVYAEAYRLTGNSLYKQTVVETLDFILREMTDSTGGWYSALDADSEGEEGKFYVWSKAEIDSLLGDQSESFCKYYNVTTRGNFEGHNILNLTEASDRLARESGNSFAKRLNIQRKKLMTLRSQRVRPLTDDKILTAWNGLALSAFCQGYQITGEKRFLDAAIKNANFVRAKLYDDGKLTHAFREGRHSDGRFLEDYAFYSQGLLDLYETDLENNADWLEFATQLSGEAVKLFMDTGGTLYLREEGLTDLIMRPKDENDSALPAPGSILIGALLKLNRITGQRQFVENAQKGLNALSGQMGRSPAAMTTALIALDYMLKDKIEIVIVGDGTVRDAMVRELYSRYLPGRLLAVSSDGSDDTPLFESRERRNPDETLAYVCVNSTCKLPVSSVDALKAQLDAL